MARPCRYLTGFLSTSRLASTGYEVP
ncbi:hypothetical protein FMEAI12_5040007 [Parafrankia sp. Ea1.12]|nr:hypothetical protein FMEAI12_5040007 [Parafrankia sp. Ea1.12]